MNKLVFLIAIVAIFIKGCRTEDDVTNVKCIEFKLDYNKRGCRVMANSYKTGLIRIIGISGLAQYSYLDIRNSTMTTIKKYFTVFTNLEIFNSSNSNLEQLSRDSFSNATKLTSLILQHNKIKNWDSSICENTPRLKHIDLSYNKITDIDENAFDKCTNLVTLKLSHNNIYKTLKFDSLVGLVDVELDSNHLEQIYIQNLPLLKELKLSNNNLSNYQINITHELSIFDISNNPKGMQLNSSYVNITSADISENLLIASRMEVIDASVNQIAILTITDPASAMLIELNLSRNNLTNFQQLKLLTKLQKLDLSFNRIEDIELSSFSNMIDLEVLNLENSGLKTIEFGLFSHQNKLRSLDISYNNLTKIDLNIFALIPAMRILFIDGNNLTEVNLSTMENLLTDFEIFGLSNNNFNCTELTKSVKVLSKYPNIEIYVDKSDVVTNSTNIKGMACSSSSSSDLTALSTNQSTIIPIHLNAELKNHTKIIESIDIKIKELIDGIDNANRDESIQFFDEYSVLRDEIKIIKQLLSSSDSKLNLIKLCGLFIVVSFIIFIVFKVIFLYVQRKQQKSYLFNNSANTLNNMEQSLL